MSNEDFEERLVSTGSIEEKRRFPRRQFKEAVNYHLRETQDFGGCLAADLSTGGIRINFNEFVPLNTEIQVQIHPQGSSKVLDLIGKVVWVSEIPFSERYQIGLQFIPT